MYPTQLFVAASTTTSVATAEPLVLLRPLISRRVGLTVPPAACLRDTARMLLWT